MSDSAGAIRAQLKVGQLLVREGKMRLPQVSQVLFIQRKGDGRQFGRIAMDLGFVTEQDVALALLSS